MASSASWTLALLASLSLASLASSALALSALLGLLASGIDDYSLIKLISHISLVGLIGFSGWIACTMKKMWWWIASFGCSDHDDMFPYRLAAAIQAAAETIPQRRMQAAYGVATMSRATEISNAAIHFYCAYYTHLFVRESWLWHVFLPRLNSNLFGDTLQTAKQLFFSRLPQMIKYCVMRDCDNIPSWIPLS
jgi:hypothetical protein